ncbi:hypothetical protein Btru_065074 [Bulinus truncatus]|nr:hypothetical protein Btru_065074 [Bulinus truncatus]
MVGNWWSLLVVPTGGPNWWSLLVVPSGGPNWWSQLVVLTGGPNWWSQLMVGNWWSQLVVLTGGPNWWSQLGRHELPTLFPEQFYQQADDSHLFWIWCKTASWNPPGTFSAKCGPAVRILQMNIFTPYDM